MPARWQSITTVLTAALPIVLENMERCGTAFGEGLSTLIVVLNPEQTVGGIFARCGDLLTVAMQQGINQEALPTNAKACRVVPAALEEQIGDFAALSMAFRQITP